MASFKSNPIFSSLVAVCLVAAAAEVYLIVPLKLPFSFYNDSNESIRKLVKLKNDADGFKQALPTPNPENKKLVADDVAQAAENLAKLRDSLTGKGGMAEKLRAVPAPTDPSAFFFQVNEFRSAMLKKFEDADVAEAGRPDLLTRKIKLQQGSMEWFGFASHTSQGPVGTDMIAKVFRQMQVSEYLLDSLLGAQPFEFISLQREMPLTKAEQQERDRLVQDARANHQALPEFTGSVALGMDLRDFFEIDPLITARRPGFVETAAFRLTFVAKSDALRSLLNKFAAFELPLVVRRVDVDTSGQKAPPPPPPEPELDPDTGQPLPAEPLDIRIETMLCRFIVTVEYIDLVAPTSPAADASSKPSSP